MKPGTIWKSKWERCLCTCKPNSASQRIGGTKWTILVCRLRWMRVEFDGLVSSFLVCKMSKINPKYACQGNLRWRTPSRFRRRRRRATTNQWHRWTFPVLSMSLPFSKMPWREQTWMTRCPLRQTPVVLRRLKWRTSFWSSTVLWASRKSKPVLDYRKLICSTIKRRCQRWETAFRANLSASGRCG